VSTSEEGFARPAVDLSAGSGDPRTTSDSRTTLAVGGVDFFAMLWSVVRGRAFDKSGRVVGEGDDGAARLQRQAGRLPYHAETERRDTYTTGIPPYKADRA
jgi:hypothetical protein